MSRKKLLLAAVVCILLLATGCARTAKEEPKKEEPKPNTKQENPVPKPAALKPGDYFPLTKGSSWKYLGEGNEYASFTREVLFVEGTRAQIKEANGGTTSAAVFETAYNSITRVFFQGEAYEDDLNFLNETPKEQTIILKAPLKAGNKWQDPGGEREITSVTETVETPAGKFENCIKVKITGQDSTLYEYFKEGVGMVKREFISGDTTVTSTLEKYEIKE